MLKAEVNTSLLTKRMLELATVAKADTNQLLRKEAGIIVGQLIEHSPPGGGSVKGDSLAARRQGESRVESDIRKLFPTSRKGPKTLNVWATQGEKLKIGDHSQSVRVWNVALTTGDLARLHKMSRRPGTGRTWVRGNRNIAVTRVRVLNRYVREQQKKVGLLSAGFIPAATKFKTAKRKQPAWIRRHSGQVKGVGDEKNSPAGIVLRIENNQGYFGSRKTRSMQDIAKRREKGLSKAIDAIIARKARRRNAGLF